MPGVLGLRTFPIAKPDSLVHISICRFLLESFLVIELPKKILAKLDGGVTNGWLCLWRP